MIVLGELLKRIKLIVIAFVVALTLLTVFGIYSPLQKSIDSEKYKNFITTSKIYEQSLDAFVSESLEKASILSNDYYTRTAFKAYSDGELTEADMTARFVAVFPANLAIMDDLVYGEIGSNGHVFSTYGTSVETYTYDQIKSDYYAQQYIELEDQCLLRVTYPIRHNYTNTGYMVLYFDLDSVMKVQDESNLSLFIYNDRTHLFNLEETARPLLVSDTIIYRHDSHFDYMGTISSGQLYYIISIEQGDLFGNTNTIVKLSIILLVIIMILSFILFNRQVYIKANSLVEDSIRMKKELSMLADYDSLTKAYSRNYFDRFVKQFSSMYDPNYSATLVMIDFDNLGLINDTYGHLVGDNVLKKIAALILDSLRKNDLFFRFGGDEFIVILEDCDTDLADKIITRIINEIKKENESLSYEIGISYGYSELYFNSDLFTVIHEADQNMYLHKKVKSGKKDYDLFTTES